MERELDDVNHELSSDKLHEMEERRIDRLNEARIDEVKVLEVANENQNTWNSYFNENIVRGKDDVNFCIRDQWTAIERSEFNRLFKVAMTFNKLYDSVKKVVGEQRKNKPDLIVRSLNGKASQKEIDLRADLVRTIAYQSQTDLVYQTAFKSALMMGFGAFQICIDYKNPRSFDKVVRYDLITDPTVCSWDPTAVKPHKGDGNFCSRRFVFTRDEFFATYPYITDPVSYTDPYMLLDFQWQTRDTIIVCDNFVKEWYPLEIILLSSGDVVTEFEWKEMENKFSDNKFMFQDTITGKIIEKDIPTIVGKRQTQDYDIMHYRCTRDKIIDFSVWPSKQLPIPFVDGDSYYIEGRQYTKSLIHEARDAQKCVNFFGSEIATEVKNRRREQWIGTPDNIAGQEQQWRNPEMQMGILLAKPDPKTRMLPQRQQPWDISAQLMVNTQRSSQDIREILGFSESEALNGRDISGKARRERKMEGSMASYVFFDNLNQAIEQGGRIVNDLLPYIIGDNERSMTVSKKDGKTQSIVLNKMKSDGTVMNRIGNGEFDVEIDTGPSFAVQKDIALEFMQETVQANPQAFNLVADLWASQLDVQMMPQIKERLTNLVPPQIIAKEQGQPTPPPQPDPQQMMMQQEMMLKQREMQLKEQQFELEAKEIQDRAVELQIRQEKHQLEKLQTVMDMKEARAKLAMQQQAHNLEKQKTDMKFSTDMANIVSDLHKHHNPQPSSNI